MNYKVSSSKTTKLQGTENEQQVPTSEANETKLVKLLQLERLTIGMQMFKLVQINTAHFKANTELS